jgi:hypothetical protein
MANMSDKTSSVATAGWVVEVFADGTGAMHRRYIVGALDSNAAIALAYEKLGSDVIVTSTSKVAPETLGIVRIELGDVLPL